MERVTRCLHCGKRTVPVPSLHSKLQCITCDLGPWKMEATAWVENPPSTSFASSSLPIHTS